MGDVLGYQAFHAIYRDKHRLQRCLPQLLGPNLNKLALLLNIQVNVLVDRSRLELLRIQSKVDKLLDLVGAEVRLKMPLVLGQNFRLSLLAAEAVAERGLDNNLIQDSAIVELDSQGVADGTEGRVVVVLGELRVLDALDLLAQGLDQRRGGGLAAVRVVAGREAAVNEHHAAHVLDAVIAVGKVVHGLELFVDDADAGLVRPACDALDVGSRLAHGLELVVDLLGSLHGSLRMELGWLFG